jgi:phosphoribosyl-AMP cyclohydrolase
MGCGCKNKGNTTQNQTVNPQILENATQKQNETIQQTIKKTVEKYYSVNKTNGWVKTS